MAFNNREEGEGASGSIFPDFVESVVKPEEPVAYTRARAPFEDNSNTVSAESPSGLSSLAQLTGVALTVLGGAAGTAETLSVLSYHDTYSTTDFATILSSHLDTVFPNDPFTPEMGIAISLLSVVVGGLFATKKLRFS